MGKTEKKRKENHAIKETTIPKSQNTKIWDERNITYENCCARIPPPSNPMGIPMG